MKWNNDKPCEMKFKVRDKVWIYWAGDVEQYEILQVFDKTNRYRALCLTGEFKHTSLFDAEIVYDTRENYFKSELERIDKEISELQEERISCIQIIKSKEAETK